MINYDICGEYADIVHALAIVESNEHPDTVGDNGQACGILQQHPSFFAQYYDLRWGFPASVSDTWIDAEIKACANFFVSRAASGMAQDLIVQAYNLGVSAVMHGERNPQYLQRFDEALNRVRGGHGRQH